MPQCLSSSEREKYAPQLAKLQAFMANGLTGVDFVRCWISWSILPLSRHPGLMCEYTSEVDDPQRHCNLQLSKEEVTEGVKKILNESELVYSKTSLSPFYAKNKPLAVSIILPFISNVFILCNM